MQSPVDSILNNPSYTDAQKTEALLDLYKSLLQNFIHMRQCLADETETLDKLMDANGNNPEEHHAKTMVFYGRKLAINDTFKGVTSADPSAGEPLRVASFTGMNNILTEKDFGRVEVTWDCVHDENGNNLNIYKTGYEPTQASTLVQNHTLGSVIQMPTIQNMDNDGKGAGTNVCKAKTGFTITGWKINQVKYGQVNQYNDNGNDYKKNIQRGSTEPAPVKDNRTFAFASNTYKLPFRVAILPNGPTTPKLEFVLSFTAIWYNINFVIPHGTANAGAPCKVPIRTVFGNTITLPETTNITFEPGYDKDTSGWSLGQWTAVEPVDSGSPVTPTDPDGDPIPEPYVFNAGSSYIIGQDMDAGIRTLYLVVRNTGGA